eukprot:2569708-Alexandrium_andersonii.AAC.1
MSASLVGSEMCIRDRRTPSGAPGINFEAAPGPTPLKLRTPEAIVYVRQFCLLYTSDAADDM